MTFAQGHSARWWHTEVEPRAICKGLFSRPPANSLAPVPIWKHLPCPSSSREESGSAGPSRTLFTCRPGCSHLEPISLFSSLTLPVRSPSLGSARLERRLRGLEHNPPTFPNCNSLKYLSVPTPHFCCQPQPMPAHWYRSLNWEYPTTSLSGHTPFFKKRVKGVAGC